MSAARLRVTMVSLGDSFPDFVDRAARAPIGVPSAYEILHTHRGFAPGHTPPAQVADEPWIANGHTAECGRGHCAFIEEGVDPLQQPSFHCPLPVGGVTGESPYRIFPI